MKKIALILVFTLVWLLLLPTVFAKAEDPYIEWDLPIAQLPFVLPLSLDCQIRSQDEVSFKLRCRTGEVTSEKWIPGPTPVLHLPKIKQPPKKKAVKKKPRRHK